MDMDWNSAEVNAIIDQALREDIGAGDITSAAFPAADRGGSAIFVARQKGILAGLPLIERIFRRISAASEVEPLAEEGQPLRKYQEICRARGTFAVLLAGE